MYDEKILVSVIVLTFNHEKYIKKALDSIINQNTNFRYEIIVGDDASSDKTQSIVIEYAKKYPGLIVPILREINIGGTSNLVDVFKHARGKYIASCEGDDYWTDSLKLQKQIDFLQNSEYIGCVHPINIVDEAGCLKKKQKLNWIKETKVFKLRNFKGIYLPGHPVSMVYKNIFSGSSEYLDIITSTHKQVADRTIVMILLSNGDIGRISDNMASYRSADKKNGPNMTNIEFSNNKNGKLTSFEITLKLEDAAKNVLKVDVSFWSYKLELLIRSLLKTLIFGSKDEWYCFLKILDAWKSDKRGSEND